jgi:hypothetical protein
MRLSIVAGNQHPRLSGLGNYGHRGHHQSILELITDKFHVHVHIRSQHVFAGQQLNAHLKQGDILLLDGLRGNQLDPPLKHLFGKGIGNNFHRLIGGNQADVGLWHFRQNF